MRFTPVHKILATATSLAMIIGAVGIAPSAFAVGPTVKVTITKYVDGQMAASPAVTATFPMSTTYADGPGGFGAGTDTYTLDASSTPAYTATTTGFQQMADYSTNEITSGPVVGAACGTTPYALQGYTTGDSMAAAAAGTPTSTPPAFVGMTTDKFVIVWNYTCTTATTTADTTAPTVTATTPADTATGVATTTAVTATFSEAMNAATINNTTFTLTGPATTTVAGVVSYNTGTRVATFAPATTLLASTTYTATITTGVRDQGGNNAMASNKVWTFTTAAAPAPVVLTAPVISNVVTTQNSTSSQTIMWNTDTAAIGQVFYGTTSAYGASTTPEVTASTTHSATITGLTEATVYHYKIQATNAGGTSSTTDAVFTTRSSASTTPLAVTSIDSIQGTATADGTYANGFKWVIHFTVPDNETSLQMKFADFISSTTASTIPAANNIRIYSSQSSNASSASTAVVSTDNNYGTALTMTGDTAPGTPGRQVDVTVEVKVPVGTTPASYTTTFGTKTQ